MKQVRKRGLKESFCNAFDGICWTWRHERNFKLHFLAAFLVMALARWLKISTVELALLSFAVFLVLIVELINTALEKVVDLEVQGKQLPLARIAKDVAAGAVLLAALNAVILGLLIFGGSITGKSWF